MDARRKADHHEAIAARELTEQGLAATSADPFLNYEFRVLRADLLLDTNSDEALQLVQLAPPPIPPGGNLAWNEIAARRKAILGLAYAQEQNFQGAESCLKEARQIAESNKLPAAGRIAIQQANYFAARNDQDRAEKYYREAIDISLQYKEPWYEMDAHVNLAVLEMRDERYDEAVNELSQALKQTQELGTVFVQQSVLGNLGSTYYQLGEFDQAVRYLAKAQEKAALAKSDEFQEYWATNLGDIYLSLGDYQKAEGPYSLAFSLAGRLKDNRLLALALQNLAQLELKRNNLEKAEEYNTRALAVAKSVSSPYVDSLCALTTAEIAIPRNEPSKAEHLLSSIERTILKKPSDRRSIDDSSLLWQAQSDLANLYRNNEKPAQADREFAAALRTVEESRGKIKQEERRMSILDAWPFYDDYIRFLVHQNNARKALQIAEFSRARTLAEGLGIVGPEKKDQISIANTQSYLAKQNETILAYWLADEESFLWLITSSQFKVYPLPPQQKIEQEIKAYTGKLLAHQGIADSSSGKKLYEFLVRPAEKLIPKGTHVVVIPNRGLYKLNLETLVVPGAKPHYWIEDVKVEVAGSIALLTNSRHVKTFSPKKLLLIGAPIQASQEFPVLVHAEEEIQKVSRHFSPAQETIISKEKAVPSAYKASQPEQYGLLHLVTHGTASQTTPLDSAIILSLQPDNTFKLYARDIVGIPLTADVVTISACSGAGDKAYSGEGLVGLAWAFLRAGAHRVVAGLWEVDDRATPDFMDNFYTVLKHKNPADALRDAKLKMLHSTNVYRFPYYWASLQLYTGS